MSLSNLWKTAQSQLAQKHVHQLIAIAGSGRLTDGSTASREFCDFLGVAPSAYLTRYADECLTAKFENSGFALQDIVNEIGVRLDFDVERGRYRGQKGCIGFDGLWESKDGHAIVVEVKTTDAYRIDLEKLAAYRKQLVAAGTIEEARSSVLIVVGRSDTGDLEAQIRGSRHAWDIRLISVDALVRLMELREDLDDPHVVSRITEILIPREYTRVDGIIELVFATTEDVKKDAPELEEADQATEGEDAGGSRTPKFVPSSFHASVIRRVEHSLGASFMKKTRTMFATQDGTTGLLCSVSKEHTQHKNPLFWFALHPHQTQLLESYEKAYIAYGCGSSKSTVLVPFGKIAELLPKMNRTQNSKRSYWHIQIYREGERYSLHLRAEFDNVDVTEFLLADKT